MKTTTIIDWDNHEQTEEDAFEALKKLSVLSYQQEDLICEGMRE